MFDRLNEFFTTQHILIILSLAVCAICLHGFYFVGKCFEELSSNFKQLLDDQREELASLITESHQNERLNRDKDLWDDGPSPAQMQAWREERHQS